MQVHISNQRTHACIGNLIGVHVSNCFEDKAPLGRSGLLKTVVWSNSCIAINYYPPLEQYQPHLKPQ